MRARHLAIALILATPIAAGRAEAACPFDCDNDGWLTSFTPGKPKDCDDTDAAINPNTQETVGDGTDQDCDGNDALGRRVLFHNFLLWTQGGQVWVSTDRAILGNGTTMGGSITRNLSTTVSLGKLLAAIDVDSFTGPAGSYCTLTVNTSPVGGGPGATATWQISASGTQVSGALAVNSPARVVNQIAVSCDPGRKMAIDWLALQNATDILPPARDFQVAWDDIDAPGGGLTTTVVRDGGSPDVLYAGSDVGGVAIKDGTTEWQAINGSAPDALMSQPSAGIVDILLASTGTLYALTGRTSSAGLAGALLETSDGGAHWDELANTIDDDIGGWAKYDPCGGTGHGGGKLLLEGGQGTVALANGDEGSLGVSLWDGTNLCDLPNSGTALPADYVGALATGSSATMGIPYLLVGYRGRGGSDGALYLCELPVDDADADGDSDFTEDELTCASVAADVSCALISDSIGWDIRDIEVDPLDSSIVCVADNGDDPDVSTCSDGTGGIYEIDIDDSAGALTTYVSTDLSASAFSWTAGSDDLDLTGLAMDPDGAVLVAFMPVTHDKGYTYDRMYRIDSADLASPTASDWQSLDGDLNADRLARVATIPDYAGAWLEANTVVKANPYPEYHTPGNGYDGVFYESATAPATGVFPMIVATEFELWMVTGLDDLVTSPWDGDSDTTWTFWPEATTSHDQGWQTAVVNDIAQDADGNIWAPVSDLGLFQLPAGGSAAEMDCLWDYFNAGGIRVAVGSDDSVWALFYDQGSDEIPSEMGVFRTVDWGATWEYQGGGIANANARNTGGNNQPWCKDQNTFSVHQAEPFGGAAGDGFAFNNGDTTASADTWGNPVAIDVLDQDVALIGFQSYSYLGGASEVAGTLAYTIDGGANWTEVAFDGDWEGDGVGDGDADGYDDCDQYDVMSKIKGVTLVAKGDLSWATEIDGTDGITAGTEGELDFFVASRDAATGGGHDGRCALARVHVDSTGVDWTWFDLSNAALTCDVDEENMRGVVASPWSNDVFVWGFYEYTAGVHEGGVCAIDRDDDTIASRVVDPAQWQLAIGDVAPSPEVADLLFVAPLLDAEAWIQCQEAGAGDCPDAPMPLIAERVGGPWVVTSLNAAPPMTTATAAAWTSLSDPWLLYGTEGGGAWRGQLTW